MFGHHYYSLFNYMKGFLIMGLNQQILILEKNNSKEHLLRKQRAEMSKVHNINMFLSSVQYGLHFIRTKSQYVTIKLRMGHGQKSRFSYILLLTLCLNGSQFLILKERLLKKDFITIGPEPPQYHFLEPSLEQNCQLRFIFAQRHTMVIKKVVPLLPLFLFFLITIVFYL